MTGDVADRAPAEERERAEQRVTWAELFFDLVWVFAITQIAVAVAHAHSVLDLATAIMLFLPLWMGWVGAALLGNATGESLDGVHGRLLVFALAACGLGMSVAVPEALGDRGVLFGVCYVLMRLILWQRMRRWPTFGGLRIEPFSVSLLAAGPLFLVGSFLDSGPRQLLWALGAVIEVLGTALLGKRLDRARFETSHLPERFGLFVIMALGETVIAAGGHVSEGHLGTVALVTLGVAFVLIVLLWWAYFHYSAPAARHSLDQDPVQARIVRDVFSYAHLAYAVAIILMAVGLEELLAHPMEHPHELPQLVLAPGAALYLAGFCYARWRMFGAPAVPRSTGVLACLGVAVAAPALPLLVTAVLVALVLAAVNGVEAFIVETGRPLPLLRVPGARSARR
ncbi:low temperature requirement protein A [Kitasatospora sp. NPDC002040]|uniref:low temperature requirement protein A n=1 Tax=Kitasatospora sp. NPDC002040 TaxID=3154661 RepID=UPI003323529B